MFIRRTAKTNPSTGKQYFTYQLIESYRTNNGPRQRILLTLTSCPDLDATQRKSLANRIEEIIQGYQPLFPYPQEIESLAKRFSLMLMQKNERPMSRSSHTNAQYPVTVDLNSVQTELCRSVGAEHVVLHTMRELGLEKKLAEFGFTPAQIRYALAAIAVKAIHPASERESWRWLQNTSGMDTLLHTNFSKVSKNPLYDISDRLLQNKIPLEHFLRDREKTLFGLQESIILYDMTNTFFEGEATLHSKAARGKSKEKRADRPLISLGVVLDSDGFPKCTEIFEGNISESSSLLEMIRRLNVQMEPTASSEPIIVMDAGIATEANVAMLEQEGYRYMVMMKRKNRPIRHIAQDVIVKQTKDNTVYASIIDDPETGNRNLCCYSTARHKRELDIQERNQGKLESELRYLAQGLTRKGRLKDYDRVLKKLGALKQKYTRVAHYYEFDVRPSQDRKRAVALTWTVDTEGLAQALSGTYGMRTNIRDLDAKELWHIYMALSHAEEMFRTLKSEIGLRPIYHQKEKRIDGHLFLTCLAYHVAASLRYRLASHGIDDSWQTVRNTLATHMIVTTAMNQVNGARIHMRGSSSPEPSHLEIYRALGCSPNPVSMTRTNL